MSSTPDWLSEAGGLEGDSPNNLDSYRGPRQTGGAFVEWDPEIDGLPRQKPPFRTYHKKSRTGCAQCRARRVKPIHLQREKDKMLLCQERQDTFVSKFWFKGHAIDIFTQCDEIHPICGYCQRSTEDCTYDRPQPAKRNDSPTVLVHRNPSLGAIKPVLARTNEPPALEMRESRSRRLLELRLFHHYMFKTLPDTTNFATEAQEYLWTIAWPQKAFEYDALLNSMYAIAALHWSKLEPQNQEASEAHRKYMDLALSGHRDEVVNISKKNADAVCLTSSLLRLYIFSGLATRDIDPYTPPSAWLKSIQASGVVWATSWKWIADDETAIASALFKSTPALMDPALMFNRSNRKGLNHLLRCNLEDDATLLANAQITSCYETTLSFIGGIKLALSHGEEDKLDILKRLASFPMWISRQFTPLLEECQPRALVILSHYFALLTHFKDFWWIADAGEREIRAIIKILPPKWLPSMAWPMKVLEEPSVLTLRSSEDLLRSQVDGEADEGPKVEYSDFTVPFGAGFRGEHS